MNKTSIEWVKNPDGTQGYTWNPITGCLNGCEYCYARKLANGRLKQRYLANKNIAKLPFPQGGEYGVSHLTEALHDPFYPRFWENRWLDLRWQASRGIFVCDMGELFGDWIPKEWQERVFDYIKCYPKCRFYLLTKQPQNLIKFSPYPKNCWVGVTYTGGDGFTKALAGLKEIQASVKYLSIEPFLAEIPRLALVTIPKIVNQVIIGACTGIMKDLLPLHHRTGLPLIKGQGNKWILSPPLGAVEEIVKECDKAGVKVFQKDNLKPLLGDKLRQELPQ